MKLLGLDYGESKIGLAIGDIESGVATPFGVIKNLGTNNAIDEIKKLCDHERIEKIVIGVPVNPNTLDSEPIRRVEGFIAKLKDKTGLEIIGRDERFSTQEAQKLISKNKSKDDDISAMLILQNYFDSASK
ncbi:Holliday junction resolvase RuvX [Candidatus Falkowbacteria bacterium]|uniref:Putative pre-16S rRNA nuclease n=1 Tax=Candidatus Buchananbacteria bacterium CG10_big_fil_rev_8_21_14_0_10_33_19 TaxID=1974525 RepID=A0A2H0W324_9BACT|nr:Holliday junction resolvase RuvX [Candidatus Falkowbacteria bacterium]PIS05748.1 MAG: Holliday junction resolvase RuvX [Candidatus Buchananbacteria bacterium CG10_big_fil_rev_8_21_14_0_10_33_19]